MLALLEICGGRLNNTDMEKLLFAFCAERGVNYYDFFPFRFGCFSFLSYQDKRVLTQQGYLADHDAFVLESRKSLFADLDKEDKDCLREFVRKTAKLRGNALVRDIYLKHPYYACRSEIKERILNGDELKMVDLSKPKENGAALFTIGYEGLTIDAFIDKLIRFSVSIIVDVRRNPLSMKYGFSKTRLQNYLERAGVAYEHLPALGIASAKRKNLETANDYKALFQEYERALPGCLDELARVEQFIRKHRRVALTCFESIASSCHRHKITEYFQSLEYWKTPIAHLM